jgi:hypothetical protein
MLLLTRLGNEASTWKKLWSSWTGCGPRLPWEGRLGQCRVAHVYMHTDRPVNQVHSLTSEKMGLQDKVASIETTLVEKFRFEVTRLVGSYEAKVDALKLELAQAKNAQVCKSMEH